MKKLLTRVHAFLVMNHRVTVLANHICALLPRKSTVLDVGAGSGELAKKIIQNRPDLKLDGVDVFIRPDTGIPVSEYDGKKLPFQDDSYDYCVLADVLHHCDDPDQVIKECKRVSRKGIIIKDHKHTNRFQFYLLKLMDWVGNSGHKVELTYNFLKWHQWQEILKDNSLTLKHFLPSVKIHSFPINLFFSDKLHFIALLEDE